MAKTLNFIIFLNILLAKGQLKHTTVIDTASGPVRGLISKTIEHISYSAFKGIPYAKPPIGHLRFKPAVPVDKWTDVYDATTDGNVCTQISLLGKYVLGSEDCLFINIYTPHTRFDESMSKAVMFWIHGGAYVFGDSLQSTYGPDFILGEDVILVTFNYRLGALGFLNLEHDNATGNCALKDQNLALKWIRRNIASFGGDPNNVTISGQSAGSVSVDLHVLSDMSTDLFRQSISMSGSTLNLYWGFQKANEAVIKGFVLGSKLGIYTLSKDVLLEALYEVSAADIVMASLDMDPIPFRPTLENPDIARDEDKFLTECSLTKYFSGNYTKGPHMMGFTSDEMILFFAVFDDLSTVTRLALKLFNEASRNTPFMSLLTRAVTSGILDNIDPIHHDATHEFIKRTCDLFFFLGIDTKQRLLSRNNDYPIYYYRFSFQSNYSLHKAVGVNIDGAGHGDELPYIFNFPFARLPLHQSDIATTRRRMVRLWTNFVKYGNPTPIGENDDVLGTMWPDSRFNGVHLEIGTNLTIGRRPTDFAVEILEFFRLGISPYLNDCSDKNLVDTVKLSFIRNINKHNSIATSNSMYIQFLTDGAVE